jgi:hypothetical protein
LYISHTVVGVAAVVGVVGVAAAVMVRVVTSPKVLSLFHAATHLKNDVHICDTLEE